MDQFLVLWSNSWVRQKRTMVFPEWLSNGWLLHRRLFLYLNYLKTLKPRPFLVTPIYYSKETNARLGLQYWAWLSPLIRIILRQDPYLVKYGLQRKLFEARMQRKGSTMLDVVENWAKIQPNAKCLIQNDNIITYQGLVDDMNRRGRALYDEVGLRSE